MKHENSIELQHRIQADMKDKEVDDEDRFAVTKNRTVLLTRSTEQCSDVWDRIVRMWEEINDGDWIRHSIEREWSSKFNPKEMGFVLVSGRRSTDLVATYETIIPYVTVWDGKAKKYSVRQNRERTNRPFFPLLLYSVDAKDVESLLEGESAQLTKNKKSILSAQKYEELRKCERYEMESERRFDIGNISK